jgi:hypothetical protein
MSLVSRLIVVQSDAREAEALRYAFERRGARVEILSADATRQEMTACLRPAAETEAGPQVIVAGADTAAGALDLLGELRRAVDAAGVEAPIVYLGEGVSREDALILGATEVLPMPAFLRDVVTLAQVVAGKKRRSRDTFLGELEHFDGVFYLIRAIGAMRRSAVLTLVRGLRRGELRFFAGEVTSAQVGLMHGLAALHHLLLWRSANFELHWEDVVRRQQIPMEPDELLADARRFLAEVAEVVTAIDLAGVYVKDSDTVNRTRVPPAIHEVLRLMDGSRTVPDVVEDSRYRTFDTLRITSRLIQEGLIKRVETPSKGFSFQIGGGLGDWLLGQSGGKRGHDRKSASHGPAGTPEAELVDLIELDWSDVLPSSEGADDGLAQVVPAAVAAGEIMVTGPARQATQEPAPAARADGGAAGREGLERITSAAQRDRLFARDRDTAPPADSREQDAAGAGPDGASAAPGHEDASASMKRDAKAPERHREARARENGSATRDGNAHGFTATEEEFFRQGVRLADESVPPADTFADLDEGYEPPTFWQRLMGRKPRGKQRGPKRPSARPQASIPRKARPQATGTRPHGASEPARTEVEETAPAGAALASGSEEARLQATDEAGPDGASVRAQDTPAEDRQAGRARPVETTETPPRSRRKKPKKRKRR